MKGDTCKCDRQVTISKGMKCNQCHYAATGGAPAARRKYLSSQGRPTTRPVIR